MKATINLQLTECQDMITPKYWDYDDEEFDVYEITHYGGAAEFEITVDEMGNISWKPVSLTLDLNVALKGFFKPVQFPAHKFDSIEWRFLGKESEVSQHGCYIEVTTIEGKLTQKGGNIVAYWCLKAI